MQSNEHKIKATFTDDTIQEEKELIYTYVDDQPKELHLQLESQLIKLGDRYDLFENRDWKLLGQILEVKPWKEALKRFGPTT